MLKMGLRSIPRRKAQTVLIIVGIMISTLIMAASFGTGDTLSFSIRKAVVDGLGTIDEIIIPARSSGEEELGAAPYVPLDRFTTLQQELSGLDTIDGLAPGVGESVPSLNSRTGQSAGDLRLAGVDPGSLQGFGGFQLTEGGEIDFSALAPNEAYINDAAAQELDAVPGDEISLFIKGAPTSFTVKDVVVAGGLAGSGPTLLVSLDRAQQVLGREGYINSIVVSNSGDQYSGAEHSEEVTTALRVQFTDREIAGQLHAALSDPAVLDALAEKEAGARPERQQELASLRAELSASELSDELIAHLADDEMRGHILSALDDSGQVESIREVSTLFESLAEFRVLDVKRQFIDQADQVGSTVTSLFIMMGLFSIMVGILLIFLIFVMLAAARRSEMGMARAIGARRIHLVQMFVFEGTAYSLMAGAVGVLLGLLASALIVAIVNRIFAGGGVSEAGDFQLTRHFEIQSIVVAYCLGMVISLATVGVSAYQVSQMNIVAAVRSPAPAQGNQCVHNPPALARPSPGARPSIHLALFRFPRIGLRPLRPLRRTSWPGRAVSREHSGTVRNGGICPAGPAIQPGLAGAADRSADCLERDRYRFDNVVSNRCDHIYHRRGTYGAHADAEGWSPFGSCGPVWLHPVRRGGSGVLVDSLQRDTENHRGIAGRHRDVFHLGHHHGCPDRVDSYV